MRAKFYTPVETLQPFIKAFIVIESGDGMQSSILPDTSLTMAFRLRGTIEHASISTTHLPTSFVAGIRRSPLEVRYAKNTTNLLVIFREGGAAAFFHTPLHEFAGRPLPLNDLVPADAVCEIEERLHEISTNEERFSLIEKWLIARLKTYSPDPLIAHAMKKIRLAAGDLRIKDLVSSLPISRDPFEKKFRRIVGTSPKQFASIVRLRHLIENYSDENTFTDAAHRAGYYDQAHFIKDFLSFTGKTPKAYFAAPSPWT